MQRGSRVECFEGGSVHPVVLSRWRSEGDLHLLNTTAFIPRPTLNPIPSAAHDSIYPNPHPNP